MRHSCCQQPYARHLLGLKQLKLLKPFFRHVPQEDECPCLAPDGIADRSGRDVKVAGLCAVLVYGNGYVNAFTRKRPLYRAILGMVREFRMEKTAAGCPYE